MDGGHTHTHTLHARSSPMSPARHRMMNHFQAALEGQKEFGFADSDIDDVRRLVSDTSIYLLTVTLLASVLHLFFEFLAFKSDINFWRQNKSLRGLSVRTLFIDMFFQLTILLYLIDVDTSLLVSVPSAAGVVIQVGLEFTRFLSEAFTFPKRKHTHTHT